MNVHISEPTKNLLKGKNYIIEERGKLEVKGKGIYTQSLRIKIKKNFNNIKFKKKAN